MTDRQTDGRRHRAVKCRVKPISQENKFCLSIYLYVIVSELYSGHSVKTFEAEDVVDFAQLTLDVSNNQLIVGARCVSQSSRLFTCKIQSIKRHFMPLPVSIGSNHNVFYQSLFYQSVTKQLTPH